MTDGTRIWTGDLRMVGSPDDGEGLRVWSATEEASGRCTVFVADDYVGLGHSPAHEVVMVSNIARARFKRLRDHPAGG